MLLAGVLSVVSAPAAAQKAQLDQTQAEANARPDPPALPARVVPVPKGSDLATAALVAALLNELGDNQAIADAMRVEKILRKEEF